MEQIFLKILNMSITASYCALAVMVLRLFLKKLPKVYSYALWLIVLFRLVCPVSFESVFSLMRVSTEAIPADIAVQEVPGQVEMAVNRAIAITAAPVQGDSANPLQIVLFACSILWLLVAAGFLGYGIGTYLKMRQKLKGAGEQERGVFASGLLKTPFVLGFLRPVIYLPEGLSSVEREYVLEHERTHIARRDHVMKLGAFLLMCIHWFNPVLWASYFLMCKDMEMSCDEKVIKKLAADHTLETKKDYASTLLALASGHRYSFGGPLAFGEGNIRKRIANVLQYKKRTVIVSALLTMVVIVAAFVLLGNPKQKAGEKGQPGAAADPTPVGTDTGKVDQKISPVLTGVGQISEDGNGYLYGIVSGALIENEYFILEVPKECENEISYYAEIKENAVQSIRFYMAEVVDEEKLKGIAMGEPGNASLAWIESYYWDGAEYYQAYPLDNALSVSEETKELADRYSHLCAVMNQAKLTIYKFPKITGTGE